MSREVSTDASPSPVGDVGGVPPTPASPPGALPALPLDLVMLVLSSLPANDIACTARVLCKATASHFRPRHSTVRLSQPVPPHAFAWRYGPSRKQQLQEGPTPTGMGGIKPGARPSSRAAGPAGRPDAFRLLSFRRKVQLLAVTAATGATANLATLRASARGGALWAALREPVCACAAAARGGHMDTVLWLLQQGYQPPCRRELLRAAMQHCSLADVCRLPLLPGEQLCRGGGALSSDLLAAAAAATTADACDKLRWLLDRGCPLASSAVTGAASRDGLQAVALLHEAGCEVDVESALPAAAGSGGTAVLTWLLGRGAQPDQAVVSRALASAAAAGSMAALRLLLPLLLPDEPETPEALSYGLVRAARGGHVEAMEEVLAAGAVAGEDVVLAAAASGSLAAARVALQAQRSPPRLRMVQPEVGARCDVAMLQLLCEEGALSLRSSVAALRIAQAAVEGSRPDADVIRLLQWFADGGQLPAPGDAVPLPSGRPMHLLGLAASAGRLEVVQWVHARWALKPALRPGRVPKDSVFNAAVKGGCEAVAEWLAEQGYPRRRPDKLLAGAEAAGDTDTRDWLLRVTHSRNGARLYLAGGMEDGARAAAKCIGKYAARLACALCCPLWCPLLMAEYCQRCCCPRRYHRRFVLEG